MHHGEMNAFPPILSARTLKEHPFDRYVLVFQTEVKAEGPITFEYLLWARQGSQSVFLVASERNPPGGGDSGSHVLAIYTGEGRVKVETSDQWGDMECFARRALELTKKRLQQGAMGAVEARPAIQPSTRSDLRPRELEWVPDAGAWLGILPVLSLPVGYFYVWFRFLRSPSASMTADIWIWIILTASLCVALTGWIVHRLWRARPRPDSRPAVRGAGSSFWRGSGPVFLEMTPPPLGFVVVVFSLLVIPCLLAVLCLRGNRVGYIGAFALGVIAGPLISLELHGSTAWILTAGYVGLMLIGWHPFWSWAARREAATPAGE